MKKRRKSSRLSQIGAFLLASALLIGLCPPGVQIRNMQVTVPKVKAAESISNPRIVKDSSMKAGQKVTWDCLWFGSYPQSEVTKEESIYDTLKSASGWDSNNDITVNGTKYRRLKGEDSAHIPSQEEDLDNTPDPSYYDWKDDYQTYHYFKYEPIKWRVLNKGENDVLLLADVALDNQKYNTNGNEITWETSSVRSWLNGYSASTNEPNTDYSKKNFCNAAFSSVERKAIITTKIVKDNNSYYGTDGGNNTSDKVFFLAESEVHDTDTAVKYGFVKEPDTYTYDEARMGQCSTYAFAMGAWKSVDKYAGNVCWWLRTPGGNREYTAIVWYDGVVGMPGYMVDNNNGVRPALHLNLASSNLYSYAGTVCSDGTKDEVAYIRPNPGTDNSSKPSNPEPSKEIKVSSVRLSGLSKQIASGKKITLKVSVLPANATNKKLTWKSSNTKVATVSQSGVVTLKKNSGGKKVTITATAQDGSKKSASWKITSMKGIVKNVKVSGKTQVKAGKSITLKAKVSATKKANTKLKWSSSNTKVATISQKGVVKANKKAKGKTVKITVMATDGSNKKATIKVKIK